MFQLPHGLESLHKTIQFYCHVLSSGAGSPRLGEEVNKNYNLKLLCLTPAPKVNEHEPQIIDMGFSVIICIFRELLGINTRVCQGRIMDTLGSDVPWPRSFWGRLGVVWID